MGTIDWAPKDSLVTPAACQAASLAAETVSGLHSTVTSAPGAMPTPAQGVEDAYERFGRQQ